jgi:hypothetical protein
LSTSSEAWSKAAIVPRGWPRKKTRERRSASQASATMGWGSKEWSVEDAGVPRSERRPPPGEYMPSKPPLPP